MRNREQPSAPALGFFFSSRRRHTRCSRDWSQTCALPIWTILALAGVAQWLMSRGRRRLALAVCALYGGLAVFADGWPGWGADFGGVPAFLTGLAVFLILLSGRRVSAVRLGLVGLAGIGLITAIAVADRLRP